MKTQASPPNKFFFSGYEKIESGLLYSSIGGTFKKVEPKARLYFSNPFLRQKFNVTDLDRKRKKRNDKLDSFKETYQPFLKKKLISVMAIICYADKTKDIGDFIKFFINNTLKRFKIEASSYIYVYDIGKESLRPHWHLFIVTEPFCKSLYSKIFKKNQEKKVKGEPMWDCFTLIEYCKKKELFVGKNNRNHGNSIKFDFPEKTKQLVKHQNNTIYSELNAHQYNSISIQNAGIHFKTSDLLLHVV
jgi:hypothetical protein